MSNVQSECLSLGGWVGLRFILKTFDTKCYYTVDLTQSHSALIIPWIVNPQRRETGFRPPIDVTKCLPLLLPIRININNDAEFIKRIVFH